MPASDYNAAMSEVIVRIPAALREFTAGEAELRVAAATVREALEVAYEQHPQLLQRLTTADGELRPFVNVFVGRDNVRDLQGLATTLRGEEILSILAAVAGG
jgi:molybdopterin converting factor small subunit